MTIKVRPFISPHPKRYPFLISLNGKMVYFMYNPTLEGDYINILFDKETITIRIIRINIIILGTVLII